MDKNCENELDSQFLAESVVFLDSTFDISFTLQNSLIAVKEFIGQESQDIAKPNSIKTKKDITHCNKTLHYSTKICSLNCTEFVENETKSCDSNVVNNKKICEWGLPNEIVFKYKEHGITEMFDWQVSCLRNTKILIDLCNLIYSAPTSAGKTLVAEILTIKTVIERNKKVIIILPFVSIVREKMFYLQDILSSSGLRVEGFMGSHTPPGGFQAVHVAVCTIEKANSLVNKMLDDGTISDLGAVIVDELHLLGDPHRGYILELLLTKIKYVTLKFEGVHIQIIGMSATLPNLEILSKWLNAELFVTQFRPIPLEEYSLIGAQYYNKSGDPIMMIDLKIANNDSVIQICFDTIEQGCSVLIFCMTKNWCENLAQAIALTFYKLGCSDNEMGIVLRKQLNTNSILEVLEQLKNCPVGLDEVLKKTISFGVAYHHAGLTFDERDIIEGAFKMGAIRVLVATSTLSSGVNLPARKVIIRSPMFQKQPINTLTYKQMVGRAGRMGRDIKGESILICTEAEKNVAFNLMKGELDPVVSCIDHDDKYMRAILEVIASQVACTESDLDLYTKCTLLFFQDENMQKDNQLLSNTLEKLKTFELIRLQKDDENIKFLATPLGKACLSSSMAPNDGLSLFCELQKARQCLVLETDLHLIYLVTPYSVSSQWANIDWLHLLTLWDSLPKAMKKVGDLVGIQESLIIQCVRGVHKLNTLQNKIHIHKRFYTALALQDLVNEVPLSDVANKFQCPRGFLQSLQQGAAVFAGMVTTFCHQLGWKNMETLISQFQDRLHFGIHSELLELMRLPSLNGLRARSLFSSGFGTISSIATSEVNIIENALYTAVPFQSEKERDGDDIGDTKKRNQIKSIWVTGYCGLTIKEVAENLILEARHYLQHEIGVEEIKWTNDLLLNDGKIKSNIKMTEIINNAQNVTPEKVVQKGNGFQNKDSSNSSIEFPYQVNNNNVNKINKSETRDLENGKISINTKSVTNLQKQKNINEKSDCEKLINYIKNQDHNTIVNLNSTNNTVTQHNNVWESLNFTEHAFDNISKLRVSNAWESINFENINQNSMTCKNIESVKPQTSSTVSRDVSLFSSDEGDNSSLFEESLPLDLLPSKLLDNNSTEYSNYFKDPNEKTLSTTTNNIISHLDALQCALDDDENIKLIYDEDVENNSPKASQCEHRSNSQEENFENRKSFDEMKVDDNGQPKVKKLKLEIEVKKTRLPGKVELSRLFTLCVKQEKVECYKLKNNDINELIPLLSNSNSVSLFFNTARKISPQKFIGNNIFKKDEKKSDKNFTENEGLGIAFFLHRGHCVYIDLNFCEVNSGIIQSKLSKIFQKIKINIKLLSIKKTSLNLKKWFNTNLPEFCTDVSILEWLINSDEKEPTFSSLFKKYLNLDFTSVHLNYDESIIKKYNEFSAMELSCLKAWAVWYIAKEQCEILDRNCPNIQQILDVENMVSKVLSDCEYCGLAVDKTLASKLLIDIQKCQDILQKKAYQLCGYHFNLNSSNDVAKVLGIYNGRKVSTKKSVLTSHNTPMSSTIMFWRKLNAILTKTLYPLTAKASMHSYDDRISPSYTTHTCSGRISMHEPNLQNVPRTFSIPTALLSPEFKVERSSDVFEFNCRDVFIAKPGYILISADYCQLEMRILTHYCEDTVLTKIMSSDVDVFKSIAATWGSVPEEDVDEDLRHRAKQLCYGIIYGMGSRTLGHLLDISEMEASFFMESFYKMYPAIKKFVKSVIEECKKKGYIETLMKRRRYLPDINSKVLAKRNSAERQAVNTTIQGSAADIAKAAMCSLAKKMQIDYKEKLPTLILQLHDELIYEVPEIIQHSFIGVLKQSMENTVRLNVPLPVKVKSGYKWGSLKPIAL